MSNEERMPSDDEESDEDTDWGELSNVPMLEDHCDVNEDTVKTEWVSFMLASPPMPGYPGPVRYGWWPGRFKDGKRV